MPPKTRITKKDIIDTALEIVRIGGDSALNARNIASRLGCSTQPIFSNFLNMEELRRETINETEKIYLSYLEQDINSAEFPAYKASGMAYIRFATEEPELFKLLFMRDRTASEMHDTTAEGESIIALAQRATGLGRDEASLFHLEMWLYVHGIASTIATGYLEFERELISLMLSDMYQGLKGRYEEKEKQ